MIIYKATNLINSKVYIGQTFNSLKKRKNDHNSRSSNGSSVYFHNAIRKHGPENFKWQVICICPDIDSLNEQEEYYIAFYDSMNVGYNLQSGGLNYIVSEETRKKLGKVSLGRKRSAKTRKKMSESGKAKIFTKEHRKNLSIANLGRKLSDEHKNNLSIAHVGYAVSDETKKKISKARLGKKLPELHKKHIKEGRLKYLANMRIAQLDLFKTL
ncbi:MAG: GIY-YIG nuclease family protein [Candidatus Neomarinimicrobiota bacterium]